MKKSILFIISIFITLNCFADDGYGWINPFLGGFEIQESSSIEMTDEVVEIWEDHVKVKFHFTNLTDEHQKVTIGFPVNWRKETGSHEDANKPLEDNELIRKEIIEFYDFNSTCNGNPLKRKLISNARENPKDYEDKCDFWFVAELSFKPKQVLEVIDEYNHEASKWYESTGWQGETYNYVLRTGSSWSNEIKKATILFHTRPEAWLGGAYVVPEKKRLFDGTTKNFIAPEDFWDVEFGHFMVYMLDELYQYRCACSYKPTHIDYNKETDEATVTWILENIKPVDDWIVSYQGIGREDVGFLIPFTLMRSELEKIPDFSKKLHRYFDLISYCHPDVDIEKKIAETTREEMNQIIADVYKRAFSYSPKITQQSSIIAQFLINSIYALHGYQFKNKKWTDMFSKFSWYKPETSSVSEKDFSIDEQNMINNLKKYR